MSEKAMCGNCKYWEVLCKSPMSDGVCNWFKDNHTPPMPLWVKLYKSSGAISRKSKGCSVHHPTL